MRNMLLLAIIAFVVCSHAEAQIYRWIDKSGRIQYSDLPPPADAKNVQQMRLGDNRIETDVVSFAVKKAMAENPVVLYVTDCGAPCNDARALLSKRGIPYAVRDPSTNPAVAEAMRKVVGGLDVPTLAVGDTVVKGFAETLWISALDVGGYPRSVPTRPTAPVVKPPAENQPPTPLPPPPPPSKKY